MAGFGSPVASPDPIGQGVSTLNGNLNLKRGQQALQTGQYQQQTAQAEAQQAQQTAGQRQAAAQFFQNYDVASHVGPDGTIDLDKALTNPQLKATGDAYPVIAQSLIQMKNAQLDGKQKLASLDSGVRQNFYQNVGGLSADADVKAGNQQGAGKVLDAIDQFGESGGPDAARVAGVYKPVIQALISNGQSSKLPEVLRNFQLQAQDAGKQTEQTYGTPATVDTGGTIQPGVQAPAAAGGGFTPAGPGISKTLAPTDQPAYKQAAAAASATGASRATGVASSDIERANQVSANIKSAQAGIQTTQQIDDLADQIHSGKFAGWLSKQAAAAGIQESTYARQLLEKDLGIVKTQLTSAAPSDSRAATILSGTPEATSDPQTIHGAMDYVRGSFRQNQAQGQNLAAYRSKHPDLSGFQGADDAFTGGAGPLVHEFLSLKGKDAQAAFYRRNFSSPEQALQFRNQTRAAAHTLGLDNADR